MTSRAAQVTQLPGRSLTTARCAAASAPTETADDYHGHTSRQERQAAYAAIAGSTDEFYVYARGDQS